MGAAGGPGEKLPDDEPEGEPPVPLIEDPGPTPVDQTALLSSEFGIQNPYLFSDVEPLNRVQDTHKNRSGDISSEQLLEKWNEGLEIDIRKLSKHIPNAAHFVVDLPFKDRK